MTNEEGAFLIEVAGQELVEVEFNGAFYALSGTDAAEMALAFLNLGTTNLEN